MGVFFCFVLVCFVFRLLALSTFVRGTDRERIQEAREDRKKSPVTGLNCLHCEA